MIIQNGVININKEKNITSHDVVNRIRKRLGIKKVGHTGTLDPIATGVLPICFGRATRIIEYYSEDTKTYFAKMKLGIETDTFDITGDIIKETKVPDLEMKTIMNVIHSFKGEISQTPPIFSAIKKDGKPLYKYARQGEKIEPESRKIFIENIEMVNADLKNNEIDFITTCAKGTYIRSLCSDIGKKLGVGGTMLELSRIENGIFNIADALESEHISDISDEELARYVIPMDHTLPKLGNLFIDADLKKDYLSGKIIDEKFFKILKGCESKLYKNHYLVYSDQNEFLGISTIRDNCLKPEKIIGGR